MSPDLADGVLEIDLSRMPFSFDGVVGRVEEGAAGAILVIAGRSIFVWKSGVCDFRAIEAKPWYSGIRLRVTFP